MKLFVLLLSIVISKNYTKNRTIPIYIKSLEIKNEETNKSEWILKPHDDNTKINASLFINLKKRGWSLTIDTKIKKRKHINFLNYIFDPKNNENLGSFEQKDSINLFLNAP